jgi:hypothetical protein
MRKKSLLTTNPYLKDPAKRRAGLLKFVISSSAIEGISKDVASDALTPRKRTRIATSLNGKPRH